MLMSGLATFKCHSRVRVHLRIDGEFHSYTEEWSICGAQKAKRKRDGIEIEMEYRSVGAWLLRRVQEVVWQAES